MHPLIGQLRDEFPGWNGPASNEAMDRLQELAVGSLPQDLIGLYRHHDGAPQLQLSGTRMLPARLMPIDEVEKSEKKSRQWLKTFPALGNVLWLWNDDNSNLVGLYTTGPARGWLTKLDHENPELTPAWRSVDSFLQRLLNSTPHSEDDENAAYDIPNVPREMPVDVDDPQTIDADRRLAQTFGGQYRAEQNPDMKRLLASSAMCLTPVADTAAAIEYLADPDMWTPEQAVRLLEIRGYDGAVNELETLARNGSMNGNSASMRMLVRMNTDESRRAIDRLRKDLTGNDLEMLEGWIAGRLWPPKWD